MTIGDRIKQRRMELGMSQEELAHKLGYKSRSSVNKIELGGQNLTQKKIKVIADALNTTIGYIMGWEDEVEPISFSYRYEYYDLLKEIYEFVNRADEKSIEDLSDYIKFLIMKLKKEDDKS